MVSLSRVDTSTVTSGGQQKLWVTDEAARDVLNRILTQLQILNVHQSRATDEELDETDIPPEVR